MWYLLYNAVQNYRKKYNMNTSKEVRYIMKIYNLGLWFLKRLLYNCGLLLLIVAQQDSSVLVVHCMESETSCISFFNVMGLCYTLFPTD